MPVRPEPAPLPGPGVNLTVLDGGRRSDASPVAERRHGADAARPAPSIDLDDLPMPAATCGPSGFVTRSNVRFRTSLPEWMHARCAGLVPLVVVSAIDPVSRAGLAAGGAVVLNISPPSSMGADAPGVRLRVSAPASDPTTLLVLTDVVPVQSPRARTRRADTGGHDPDESSARNEARLRLAFEAWGAGYFEFTRTFSRGYVDRRWAELFELDDTELSPGEIVTFAKGRVVPEQRDAVRAAFTDVITGAVEVMDLSFRVQLGGGRRGWFRAMGRLVSRDAGDVSRDLFAGVVFDVSDEHALQDRLSLQLAGLEAAADAIVITDKDGRVVWVNPAFTTLTGYRPEDVIGNNPRVLRSGAHDSRFYEEFWATIRSGRVWSGEMHNRRRDGTVYPEEMTVTPVRGADGEVAHFIAIKRDVTERKRVEAELIAARNAADAANRMKSQFLAMMSHELRTPLNGLIGFTELLRATRLDEEQADYVATMRSSSQTLLTVINDILDYSKVEAGRLELECAPFSVRDVVDEVVRLFGVRAREKGLSVDVSVAPDVPGRVRGDVTRVRQVISNLVGNAVKFTEAGRVGVDVKWMAAGRATLEVTVRDTGIGIAPDRLERLFQPFAQADASTTRRYGGTGLGLAICVRLVELMGGTVGASSVPGEGSEFRVQLPAEVAEAVAAPQPVDAVSVSADFARRHPLRILVVEDNPVNQKLARATLRKLGYSVGLAANGREAVEAFERGAYDLLLMDVQMPEMDGFDATRLIRSLPGGDRIYIAAMTAHSMEGDSQRCLDVGMNDYVAKPFRTDDLAAALSRGHGWLRALAA